MTAARLERSQHASGHWVIAEVAPDFRLLDAWAMPVEGTKGDFGRFLEVLAALDPADAGLAARWLFWVRERLGAVLRLDKDINTLPIPGCLERSLSERLPVQLRGSADQPEFYDGALRDGAFVPLYRTDDEWTAEISNNTVHGVLHLAWVEYTPGRYRAQLGVYVKTRGRLGGAYLRLIEPFRHLVVYPAIMRQVGRAWSADGPRAGS